MSNKSITNSDGDRNGGFTEPFVTLHMIEAAGLRDADPWCVSGSFLLSRVARVWELTLEIVLKPHGLIPAEMRVMSALISRQGQELTMGEIKQSVAVTAGGVTKAVARLETLGLVEKRPGEADRRVTFVKSTRKGKSVAKKALQDVIARFDQALGQSDEGERDAIAQALLLITRNLSSEA